MIYDFQLSTHHMKTLDQLLIHSGDRDMTKSDVKSTEPSHNRPNIFDIDTWEGPEIKVPSMSSRDLICNISSTCTESMDVREPETSGLFTARGIESQESQELKNTENDHHDIKENESEKRVNEARISMESHIHHHVNVFSHSHEHVIQTRPEQNQSHEHVIESNRNEIHVRNHDISSYDEAEGQNSKYMYIRFCWDPTNIR